MKKKKMVFKNEKHKRDGDKTQSPLEKPKEQPVIQTRENILTAANKEQHMTESMAGEKHEWPNAAKEKKSVSDADMTVSAMKDYIKQQVNSLKKTLSVLEEYRMANGMAPSVSSTSLKENTNLIDEITDDSVIEKRVKNIWSDKDKLFVRRPLPAVKLPVLLAILNVGIDLCETVALPVVAKKILQTDWEVRSIDFQVLPTSKKAWLKGELTILIDYFTESFSLQRHKMNIPWQKIVTINWLFPPERENKSRREYTFHSNRDWDVQTHYESIKTFADTISFTLKQQHFVWAHEWMDKGEAKALDIDGTMMLKIELLQTQLVDLNKEGAG